jgi:transcriptional regulator with XRE-family HTH domain
VRSDLSDEDRQFARRLVARRCASHLSRQSLARLTQLSEATIKFVEKGRTKPTVRTIAYLLLVPELELTLEDVPLSLREQVRDVLDPPRVPVCEAAPPAPPSDGLRSCSGGGREQLSAGTLDTIAFLFQVSKLNLTLDDVPPWWREQVRAALKPDGLRPCSGGGRLAPPTPPESPPSSP